MARTEKTSARVAAYAGELLKLKPTPNGSGLAFGLAADAAGIWKKVRSVCASALTQAPDKKDRKK